MGDSEASDSLCIRGLTETTGSVDRNGQYDDDADWFNGYPNREGGLVSTETDATVAQYCSHIRGVLTENWAFRNRPAVEFSALGYTSRLEKKLDNKDSVDQPYVCLVLQGRSWPDRYVFQQINAIGDKAADY